MASGSGKEESAPCVQEAPEARKSTLLRAPARQGSQSKGLCFMASFHVPPSCTQPRVHEFG